MEHGVLERATRGLVEAGKPVDGELLQFLSPLGWEHINLTGDYVVGRAADWKTGSFGPYGCPENLSVRFFPICGLPINTDKAPAYGRALALLKREGRCPSDVEHRQIKYRNNVIECDHGKLKRIIGATLGFKSMKTAYATIKGIEVMRALRKGQASAFYYGDPLGEMRLVSRVFEM